MSDFKSGVEIERKYIIMMPSVADMSGMADYSADEILQTYLSCEEGVTHRVRSRRSAIGTKYYETKKRRIDMMSADEYERELRREEYDSLLSRTAHGTKTIAKTRHTFTYLGQSFEVDISPEWQKTAILETELPSREASPAHPPFIKIVREVTGMWEYSNAAMSRHFPPEDGV